MVRSLLLAAVAVVAFTATAPADVKPHPLFTDNMVLQQGVPIPVWGLATAGDSVSVSLSHGDHVSGAVTKAGDNGKWSLKLPTQKAGTGYTLTIKAGDATVELKNVAIGEVWIGSGQSNMEWSVNASLDPEKVKAAAADPNLRLFTVAKRTSTTPLVDQTDLKHFSKWAPCGPDNVGGFSAVLYNFGANLRKNLPHDVPVGLIHTSWGGTPAEAWTSLEALEAVDELKYYAVSAKTAAANLEKAKKDYDPAKAKEAFEAAKEKYKEAMEKHKEAVEKAKADGKPAPKAPNAPQMQQPPTAVGPGVPASLYNAMIHPLLPFAIKGAIWYQGESNAGKAYEYRALFTTMIEDWRKKWGYDFPFYLVQLAPFNSGNPDGVAWPELREAQMYATTKLKHVGMAVITDAGHPTDIHPKDKFTVGTRLALAARADAYGEKVEFSGPAYKSMTVEGDKAVLTFTHVGGGLVAKDGELTGFTVAGDDKVFHPAKAVIHGDTLVVTSDKVTKPVAVRFGWKNFPVVNFFNKAGLPASPFRTDDFGWTTKK